MSSCQACPDSSSNHSSSSNSFSEILNKDEFIKLPLLIQLLEEKLPAVIDGQRYNPSYQRARLSSGSIKEEGILKQVTKIDSTTLLELKNNVSPPPTNDPEVYIAFLTRTAKVEMLANQQENLVVKIETSPQAEMFSLHSTTATFFPYNGEGINDYGWGCCWRATQTSLSAVIGEEGRLTKVPTFENLFHLFGSNTVLKKIYIDFLIVQKGLDEETAIAKAEEIFANSKFSPYQHAYGWSNPFVSQLMFHYYGLNSKMVTVNGMPGSLKERHLPEELLEADFDFPTLTDWLVKHFSTDNPLPVVIDDGKFAMAIVGVKTEGDRTTIWFADPHIKGGANHPETALIFDGDSPEASFSYHPDAMAGLYSVTFDPLGRQIDCSVKQHEVMFSRNSYEETQFHTKPWMFTFPQR